MAARQGLPSLVVGALLVAALLVLTRALHTEGFLDCCDGLFGGYTSEDRLRILRDTHVGAFAVIGGAALILTKWSLLASTPDEARIGLLLVFPCLSRFGMLATMACFSYVRKQGLGTSFQEHGNWWQVVRWTGNGGRCDRPLPGGRRIHPLRRGARRLAGAGPLDCGTVGRYDRRRLRCGQRIGRSHGPDLGRRA